MEKFKIVQRNIIMMGMMEQTFIVEADNLEDAMMKVSGNEAEADCVDIDYDIVQKEQESIWEAKTF